jgi:hypothetical protein
MYPLVAIIVYSSLAGDYFRRYFTDSPVRGRAGTRGVMTPRLKAMVAALIFSTTCLFIRYVVDAHLRHLLTK